MAIELSEKIRFYGKEALEERLNVATIVERDAIPLGERYNGMIVTVRSEGKRYELLYDGNFEELSGSAKDAFLGNNDNWAVAGSGGGSSETAQSIKTKYESNENTNAFTDAEKSKLAGIANGATKNSDTDELDEGSENKYFTEARAVASKLAGYVKAATVSAISSATSILEAIGILEKALDNKVDKVAGSGLITDAEKLIFADKYTKNETDNLISGAISSLIWKDDVAEFADLATEYPDAIEGWTSVVNDENKIYRFDGTSWVPIGDITIPMATDSVDGKMSKENFVKLRDIEAEATKNDNTDELAEGVTNKYFTDARAVAAKISGYMKAGYSAPLAETDSILQALGKLERLLDDRLSIEGENYVCVIPGSDPEANGTRLLAAYNAAKSKTPGGNPLSANNRYTVIPFPGEYLLFSTGSPYLEQLQLAEYVDLIGFGEGVYFGSASTSGITQAVNDVRLANFRFRKNGQFIYVNTSDTSKSIYKNLAVAFSSWGFDAVFNGIYEDIDASFSAGFGLFYTDGSISGTFRNIIGELRGNYGFDGAYIENCAVAQTFKNSFLRNVKIGSQDFVLDNSVLVQSSLNGNIYVKPGSEIYHCNIDGDITRDMEGEIGDPSFNVKMFGNYCSGSVDSKLTNLIINGHNSWDSEESGSDGYSTPADVRDALQSLTEENRLDASAVKGLPIGVTSSEKSKIEKLPDDTNQEIDDINNDLLMFGQDIGNLEDEVEKLNTEHTYVLRFSENLAYPYQYNFQEADDLQITQITPQGDQVVTLSEHDIDETILKYTPIPMEISKSGIVKLKVKFV